MLKEQISFLDKKFPYLNNDSKMRMLKNINDESKKLYSLVDNKIIEMPIFSEAKNKIVNYLYNVLNEDGNNKVEKYSEIYQDEFNKITFDIAVNFNEKREFEIFSLPHAYFIVSMNNKDREFYLKILEKLSETRIGFYYILIDYPAKIVLKIKANERVQFKFDNCVQVIHESQKQFKIKDYVFDMKKIFIK